MSHSRRIHVLGDQVINKIAAGEVVDRPASVVKELIENALDAGARQISVEITAGGRSLIRVADDGEGMARDDAILSVERHATSKIREVDDIEGIGTLGFRGEALAAIAAVSRFELQSATADAHAGTALRLAGGKLLDVADIGAPVGTQISVRNLFFNVPARRKFLRTEQTEAAHVRHVFLRYSLSCPHVDFRLTADEREVYLLPPCEDLRERILALFTLPAPDVLRRVHAESEAGRLCGYVAAPSVNRADRSDQYVFVNGRPAQAPVLMHAVREAYRTLLPSGRHPMLFLFLELPAADLDVNVHPTKKEVRFRRSNAVRDLVLGGLQSALAVRPERPPDPEDAARATRAEPAMPRLPITDLPQSHVFSAPRLPAPTGSRAGGEAEENPAPAASNGHAVSAGGSPWVWCRILGQVGGLFVVMETEDGLVLMDPHAAHERILYERFLAEVKQGRVRSQGLLMPETAELPPAAAEQVRNNLDLLTDLGFGLSDLGGDTFIVDALPAIFGGFTVENMLRDAALATEQAGPRGSRERWSRDRIALAACKAAVKARDRLTLAEIEQLVRDLAVCEMPYTCPHGRPTLIHWSYQECRRQFGRT